MVEARKHQLGVEHKAAMGNQRRIQEREVRGIGEHALMQALVVRKFAGRPDPYLLARGMVSRREIAREVDRSDLDRPLAFPIGFDLRRHPTDEAGLELPFAWQGFR